MRVRVLVLALSSLIVLAGGVLAESGFKVSYVSAEHIYIDAGSADSLATGDRLGMREGEDLVAEVEVVFVARHSSSCKVIHGSDVLREGVRLELISRRERPQGDPEQAVADEAEISTAEPHSVSSPTDTAEAEPTRIRGSVSMAVYHWQDDGNADLDFTQSSARLNLQVENFWQEHVTFNVRTRGRYAARSRSYAGDVARTEWINRLWVLSLEYDNPDSRVGFTAGRFLPHQIASTGYLDGGMLSFRFSRQFRTGLFGGQHPDWGYGDIGMSLTKAGGYISYKAEIRENLLADQSLGYVAEMHSGITSRTFFAWSGSIRNGSVWGVSHLMEAEINSGWRKERAGESITVSNLLLHTWWRVHRAVRVTVQYDNRRNYWTYAYRTQADSLFDDRVRQGAGVRFDVRPSTGTFLSGSVGFRKRAGDADPTTSYSAGARRTGIGGYPMTISLAVAGFDGTFEHGTNYLVRTQFPHGVAGEPYISIGGYRYSVVAPDVARHNGSVEGGTTFTFPSRLYIGGSVQWNTGDDIRGWRVQAEVGYRY